MDGRKRNSIMKTIQYAIVIVLMLYAVAYIIPDTKKNWFMVTGNGQVIGHEFDTLNECHAAVADWFLRNPHSLSTFKCKLLESKRR